MSSQQILPLRHLISPAADTASDESSTRPVIANNVGSSSSETAPVDKITSDKTLKEEEEVERQKMQ